MQLKVDKCVNVQLTVMLLILNQIYFCENDHEKLNFSIRKCVSDDIWSKTCDSVM